MCQSFYCTGFDGYGYYNFGRNPLYNNLYFGMASLNNLLGSFGINRRRSCCCGSNGSGNSGGTGVGGNSGAAGNIGNLLNGSGSYLDSNNGMGGMPMPGTNVPKYQPYDWSTVKKVEPFQVPTYTCEDIDPSSTPGVLSPDIMNLGFMPPMTNPMMSLLVGNGLLNGLDPCQLAQLLTMRLPRSSQQNPPTTPSQNPSAQNPTPQAQERVSSDENNPASNVTISPSDSTAVVMNKKTGVVTIGSAVDKRIQQIAQSLVCDPSDLKGLIYKESLFQTVPDNWNGKSAVGLLQWTKINIDDLNQNCGCDGLTKEKIAQMNVMQQLDLAEKSLLRAKAIAGFSPEHRLSPGELYAINYLPKAASQNIVAQQGDGFYEGNEGLDINKDKKISIDELSQRASAGAEKVAVG